MNSDQQKKRSYKRRTLFEKNTIIPTMESIREGSNPQTKYKLAKDFRLLLDEQDKIDWLWSPRKPNWRNVWPDVSKYLRSIEDEESLIQTRQVEEKTKQLEPELRISENHKEVKTPVSNNDKQVKIAKPPPPPRKRKPPPPPPRKSPPPSIPSERSDSPPPRKLQKLDDSSTSYKKEYFAFKRKVQEMEVSNRRCQRKVQEMEVSNRRSQNTIRSFKQRDSEKQKEIERLQKFIYALNQKLVASNEENGKLRDKNRVMYIDSITEY